MNQAIVDKVLSLPMHYHNRWFVDLVVSFEGNKDFYRYMASNYNDAWSITVGSYVDYVTSKPLYNYAIWPNFTRDELVCQHTGLENPNVDAFTKLMNDVQALRLELGVPFKVTSAYRHASHPIEASKILNGGKAGAHNYAAIDIQVPQEYYWELFYLAVKEYKFTGVGVNLAGDPSQGLYTSIRDLDQLYGVINELRKAPYNSSGV